MEPIRPNSKSNPCIEAKGSNCIAFNGTPPTCIPYCTGDTVSDMIYKLGQQECYTTTLLDWSTLNLSCIYTPCPSCQNPTKPVDILQVLVNTLCAQATAISTLQSQVASLLAGINP